MNILALDVATKTGWATKESSGVWDFSIKRDESGGMRLLRFKAKLKEIVELAEIELVIYERTAGRHKAAIIVQSELHGVMKSVLDDFGVDYRGFSATEIKKHATGKGNSGKPAMIEAAEIKFPEIKIIDDNHADALHLLDLAQHEYSS